MFELLDADEYTYTYMENNKHIFIMADADAILASLRGQVCPGMTACVLHMVHATTWSMQTCSGR
jgi:hypothetical protein